MTNVCPNCKQPIRSARSLADHRRLFGLIRAAYQHWPEMLDFQPDSEEHLRAYLTCKAGYRDRTDIAVPYAEDQPALTRLVAQSIEAAVRTAGGFAFIRPDPDGGRVAVYAPKSIAFDRLDQKGFNAVRHAIETVIEQETGLKADDLLKETESAA